ncbi:MAG: FHA domain-containing protein [Tepidisphaeraceae bacterium]
MAYVTCQCGVENDVPELLYGRAGRCGACQRILRFVVPAAEARAAGNGGVVFGACLVIDAGPACVGEQIFLADGAPIAIGKSSRKPISLAGPQVSRHHCTLFPANRGRWLVKDHDSRNGLFVNGARIRSRGLSDGDVLDIGEFTLHYLCPENGAPRMSRAAPEGAEHAALERARNPAHSGEHLAEPPSDSSAGLPEEEVNRDSH